MAVADAIPLARTTTMAEASTPWYRIPARTSFGVRVDDRRMPPYDPSAPGWARLMPSGDDCRVAADWG
jgi:hypothetical protein